jgi:4-carboxymuconolactone decarboxylase
MFVTRLRSTAFQVAVVCVLLLPLSHAAAQATVERPGGARPIQLKTPRIAPVPEAQWTAEQKALAAKHLSGERAGNAFKTLLNVPPLVDGTWPFQTYITRESSLSLRHREILILRTAWLHGSEYLWSEHAAIARTAGFSADDVRRIAQGADAAGWDPFEATLVRFADQLFRNSSVNDAIWNALSGTYDMYHLLDAVMTVADVATTSLLYNSLGVQPDAWSTERIPTDIPYRVVVPAREPPLTKARIEPQEGTGIAIGRTFARYPKLATSRSTGSNYVLRGSKLDPHYRELLILRIGWNSQAEYEWAQHVGSVGRAREQGLDPVRIAQGASAPGWDPFEQALVRAVDELYRDCIISDQTWNTLAARFDTTMMMNVVITTANYRMVSMALNALGVQIDPSEPERFPILQSR